MPTKTNMNITKFSKMNIKKLEQVLSDKDTDKGYTTEGLQRLDEQMKDMKLGAGEAKDNQVRDTTAKDKPVKYNTDSL